MPTFIDESGDTGTNPDPTNRHFRLAAVWVPTAAVADALRSDIRATRVVLGVPTGYEFKFAKTGRHPERRAAFFAAALGHEFRFVVCSVDKDAPAWRGADSGLLHWVCAVTLAATLRLTYRAAEAATDAAQLRELIVVDDNRDPAFLDVVRAAFRGLASGRRAGISLVGQVRFKDSRTDDLLQLADMLCGATAAHLNGRSEWYEMARSRCLSVDEYD